MSFQNYFAFQRYLPDQIIRALTFLVEASFNDLFRYMIAATTFGPYADDPAYSVFAFSATTNGDIHGEVRLTKLMENTLAELQNENRIEYCPNAEVYFIDDIRNTDRHRKKVSHIIFNVLAQNENRVDYATLITCVNHNADIYEIKAAVKGFGGTVNTAAGANSFTL